ncbi:uncharacterized protein AC631_05698, partial [Debaryomyces fabryi]
MSLKQQPSSSKEDLRGQFSDIQKRLFSKTSQNKANRTNEKQPPNIPLLSDQSNLTHQASNKSLRPPVPSNSSIPHPTPALGPETKGNDMNFVVGLSENLLGECRRLTAENQKYRAKLKSTMLEIQTYKDQNSSLQNSRDFQINNESDLKDKNWELESNLLSLNDKIASLNATKEKLLKLNQEQLAKLNQIQNQNDDLQLKNTSLSKDYEKLKTAYKNEVLELSDRINELNDENDQLHIKFSGLDKSTISQTEKMDHAELIDVVGHNERLVSEMDSFDINSLLKESQPEVLPASDPSNPALELETLRATLNHSNRTIAKLRTVLLRYRFDKDDNEITTPIKLRANKRRGIKNEHNDSKRNSIALSPSKRNSKLIILDNVSNDSQYANDGGKWEDFLDDNITAGKSPARILNSNTTDYGNTTIESADEPFKNNDAGIKSIHNDAPYLTDSSDSDEEGTTSQGQKEILSEELLNTSFTRDQLDDYANKNNLIMLLYDKYEELMSGKTHSVSSEDFVKIAEDKGFMIMNREEHARLLSEDEMKKKLESIGLVTLPVDEHESLTHTKDSYNKPDMEYLSSKVVESGYEIIEKEDLNRLNKKLASYNSPSQSYLISKCKDYNLHVILKDEYEKYQKLTFELEKPSKAYITNKANELGLIVSPSKFYDDLVNMAQNPPTEHIKSKAKENELKVLSNDEYFSLINPSIENLSLTANKHGFVLCSDKDYAELNILAHNPTIDHLTTKSADLNYKLILEEEHNRILKLAQSPSIDHINNVIEKDYKVIKKSEYLTLNKLANNPSLSHVKSKVEGHGLITLTKEEYADLFKLANEPPINHLRHKAEVFGNVLVEKEQYNILIKTMNTPSLEYLKQKAKEQHRELVEEKLYKSLYSTSNNPTFEFLENQASKLGFDIVDHNEHQNILKLAYDPDIEYLNSKAQASSHTVIANEDFEELNKLSHNPPIDHLKSKATLQGHT